MHTKQELNKHAHKLFPELDEGQTLNPHQDFQANLSLYLIDFLRERPGRTAKASFIGLAKLVPGSRNEDTRLRYKRYIQKFKNEYVERFLNVGIVLTPLTEYGFSQPIQRLMEADPNEKENGVPFGDLTTGLSRKQKGVLTTLQPDGTIPTWYSKRLDERAAKTKKKTSNRLQTLVQHQLTAGGASRALKSSPNLPLLVDKKRAA